jgi:magnesium chelatase family protein
VAGLLRGEALVPVRPFRSPHHSISSAGLVGGGSPPAPGEASLAQHGVLFLDELPEFSRPTLDALRQPLEDGFISLTRAQRTVRFPASFMLVAAANPCPCGHYGLDDGRCECLPASIHRHTSRLNGPLIDRVDLTLGIQTPARVDLMSDGPRVGSTEIRERVIRARKRQTERFAGTAVTCNAGMRGAQIRRHCTLDDDARAALDDAHARIKLTGRGHFSVLRVARTLADLEGRQMILSNDIREAVVYRTP